MSWTAPAQSQGLGVALLMDPLKPTRLYAGRQKVQLLTGGVFHSNDGGSTVQSIGLQGGTVGDLAFNGATTRLYATVYASGIYRATIPLCWPTFTCMKWWTGAEQLVRAVEEMNHHGVTRFFVARQIMSSQVYARTQ